MRDPAGSAKARAEGNAAYRSGRWTLAIEHYTRAAALDPEDAVPLTNRAQAYLKLDEFTLAEADCTAALSIHPESVKALYRRALARRGLDRFDAALQDVRAALKIESNDALMTEEAELVALVKQNAARSSLVPDPASQAAAPPPKPATITAIPEPTAVSPAPLSTTAPPTATPASTPSTSTARDGFAALRKTRDGKRTAYAGKTTTSTLSPTSIPPSSSAAPSDALSATPTLLNPTSTPAPAPIPVSSTPPSLPPTSTSTPRSSTGPSPAWAAPTDTASLAPGSGLRLLRSLTGSASHDLWVISHYPPSLVGRILDPVLEPDGLGMILRALAGGLEKAQQKALSGERKEGAEVETMSIEGMKEVMKGLKRTKRWKMNVAMLSKSEREAGERVWTACGGAAEGGFS